MVLTLALMGLLPLAISFFQLRSNEDSLLLQVQRTHMVAAATAGRQVGAYLESLEGLAKATAGHPVLFDSPQSSTAQELLRGTLEAQPSVVAVGVLSPANEPVVLAQRVDMRSAIGTVRETDAPDGLAFVREATEGWIRILEPMPDGVGRLLLIAEAKPLSEMIEPRELGEESQMVLASHQGEVLAGASVSLGSFPPEVIAAAQSGKITSRASRYEQSSGDVIVAHAAVPGAPWFVLSRQPAAVAEVAQQRIRRATRLAALGAVLLAALVSAGAYWVLIRPLRRLLQAQEELLGSAPEGASGGSEIARLEASFRLLEQRIRDSEELGKISLGRYQVNELVGSGAMGSVFKAWDPKLKRPVALKTVRLTSEEIDRQKLVSGLLEEATVSARFNHPNIVTVYDVADEGEAAFIAMELVEGVSLDVYLWDRGNLSPDEVIPLGAAIARALATAHQNDLVHHDVKPGNVLLGHDASIKVTDFGISQLISAASRSEETICGTPGYIAPECFQGERYGPKSDLFALGIVLYETLTGKHPFYGRNMKETMLNTLVVNPEPLSTALPGVSVPEDFEQLIFRLLAKTPDDRPTSASEVAEQLETMMRERGLEWNPAERSMAAKKKPADETAKTQLLTLETARAQTEIIP